MKSLPVSMYRADQARAMDQKAIEEVGIPGFELMYRAGSEVFARIIQRWPKASSVAVFCGIGNNAGDGYIVAGLAMSAGWSVSVYALSPPSTLEGDAQLAYQKYVELGGKVIIFTADLFITADVLVDALLGTGLNRPVSGLYALAIQTINAHTAPCCAVDVPSGLNADTGVVMGYAVKAVCTVTFIALKQGLFTGQAAEYCGEICYVSLGIPDVIIASETASAIRLSKQSLAPRNRCAHKGQFGHVLVIGGEQGYSGAARMAAEAALRVGSGLVSVATRIVHAALINLNQPEIMGQGVETSSQLESLLNRASVIVLGPGLGKTVWSQEMFSIASRTDKPIVLDADGLNLLSINRMHKVNWVLTPHPGEAARLLNCATADIEQDRFAAATTLQRQYGGVIVLKGAGTIIASEYGIAVSTSGNPGMASGGMGDILAGVIGGLLAQGLSTWESAQQGVYCHGLAADWAVNKDGERGLLATDLLPYLRQLVNQ